MTEVTTSIVVFNTPYAEVLRCLAFVMQAIRFATKASENRLRCSVCLINNSAPVLSERLTDEGVVDLFVKHGCVLSVEEGHGNVGYGKAQNLSIKKGRGDYWLIMNPDVRVAHDAILEGINYLETHVSVVGLSPRCRSASGSRRYLCKSYPSIFNLFLRGLAPSWARQLFRSRLSRYELKELQDAPNPSGVPIISGCFMFCRAPVLKAVGGFDERFFLYFEDFDLSLRLSEKGGLEFIPCLTIEHDGGGASKKGIRHIGMFVSSAVKFFNKHGWRCF